MAKFKLFMESVYYVSAWMSPYGEMKYNHSLTHEDAGAAILKNELKVPFNNPIEDLMKLRWLRIIIDQKILLANNDFCETIYSNQEKALIKIYEEKLLDAVVYEYRNVKRFIYPKRYAA